LPTVTRKPVGATKRDGQDETQPASVRPPRVYGPEPWKTLRGESFTHWDLWLLVLAASLPDGWAGLTSQLNAKRSNHGYQQDDAEAKLSQIDDLLLRLTKTGLTPAQILGAEGRTRNLLTKARNKVLEQVVTETDKTPAMRDTPRRRLEERALRGYWSGFPCSPSSFEPLLFAPADRREGFSEAQTLKLATRLDRLWRKETKRVESRPAEVLALHRAMMTALVVIVERADDSCGSVGDLFSDVYQTYSAVDWKSTGIAAEVYFRDAIEFGIWEDYGFTDEMEAFFAVVDPGAVPTIEAVFQEVKAELTRYDFAYQLDRILCLRATFLVAYRRFDDFVGLAAEMGSRAWKPIVSMAEAAWKARKKELALAVFGAANQPGWHQEHLQRECQRITKQARPSPPRLRRVK
jgi:hypothetical protein